MSRHLWHQRLTQLARHYQAMADGQERPERTGEPGTPEPIGWRSGATDAYRRCAEDLHSLADELTREEQTRRTAGPSLVLATGGSPWMPLEVRRDPAGRRHYLDGRPTHPGDLLEILLPGGQSLRGRYELEPDSAERPDPAPILVIEVAGGNWGELEAFLHLPAEARFRWPPEAA